ncbi:hypothetical protein EFR84_27705 [Rhizobium chutanense]|uniref:Uncharacterized protein n=1 Tax=Rhizobium chutanense TaxID=2035448 RepID=A0A3S0S365_9HYPH|nr:hypothetical protein EFR84_27705 [Rhizobium chutanense]
MKAASSKLSVVVRTSSQCRSHCPPSFLCSSQESSRRASARRRESFQPKDLGWLDLCDEHRDEGGWGSQLP